MTLLDELRRPRAPAGPRLLFTDGDDDRVLAAVAELVRLGAVRPTVLGELAAVTARARTLGVSLEGVAIVSAARVPGRERHVEVLAGRRGIATTVAAHLLDRPIHAALALLVDGELDGVVAGVGSHTRDVLIACEMWLGLPPGVGVASGAFVMDVAAGPLVFADCAVTPSPTPAQLADIALASATTAHGLLAVTPRVAMLSFSTHGSATHPDVDRVVEATELARALRPDLALDGELQADAALDPKVAGYKHVEGAGRANVLVFPDLDAANIGYKLVRTLASANAYGVFLQGYGKPIVKLSRGASTDEIVGTGLLLGAHPLR